MVIYMISQNEKEVRSKLIKMVEIGELEFEDPVEKINKVIKEADELAAILFIMGEVKTSHKISKIIMSLEMERGYLLDPDL